MLPLRDDNRFLLLVSGVVLLSRIPFLLAGYGSEEDAWGLILVSRNISLSGIYEVSRMPGHPVQEYLLSYIWNWPAWTLNFLTTVVSTSGVLFFMLALRRLNVPHVVLAGLALAFTPVYYMHSTNVMDYTWALALMMLAFYLTVTGRYIVAGIVIGVAVGFRITAGAFAIPLALWHFLNYRSLKTVFISGICTLITALICFIPAFTVYGTAFFTYYEYFPYPPFLKSIYKGTVGAWGVAGMAGVVLASLIFLKNFRKTIRIPVRSGLTWFCIAALALYTFSFLKIPQKTAFVIPLIPFIVLLFVLSLSQKQMMFLVACLVFSCFFLGINLDDPNRGSQTSNAAISFRAGNTPLTMDLFQGVVLADHSKRKVKMHYARNVVNSLASVADKTVVVAGWWQNELNYFSLNRKNPNVSYVYYADENQLLDSIAAGCHIVYLPEQDHWNDLRWKKTFTHEVAQPLIID